MSVAISSISLMLQVLQLRSLSQKESFNSVFDLIQTLARGTYIAGVNQIRNSSSSILNVTTIVPKEVIKNLFFFCEYLFIGVSYGHDVLLTQRTRLGRPFRYLEHVRKVHKNFSRGP